ncbi:polyphosphate polymerase domain-containing protein [Buchananella hordeovulneris]|uniref:polyphosphate polymerase domain-containing protein n=1 Tax=Buchananella hordeovulneris TaxID=52770 RepID=UPI0026DC034C|nr:polyphosphate polymerase domain-containing protein [Buchananella hordeovulneris]MDO5080870.1 polyphosphate polymerase domain-containing protein [Buchananella hordeovulneris]
MSRHLIPEFAIHLSQLAPVSLAELSGRAALLTRVDRKYTLTTTQVVDMLPDLPTDTRVLDIAGRTRHSYQTTYFDTPRLDSFYSSLRCWRRRFKVRLRNYTDSGLSFVEVKTRGPRGATVKNRLECSLDKARENLLDLRALAWIEDQLVGVHCAAQALSLAPSLHGSYTRTTLLLPGQEAARATIDWQLRWALPQGAPLRGQDLVIVETKSGPTPSTLDRVLWARGIRPTRFSKYATALTALKPELPTNRWHRTLRRHFSPGQVEVVPPATSPYSMPLEAPLPANNNLALAS